MIVGEKTPAVLLLAFVPMYLIAVAFRELNRAEPDCGTTFTWVSRAFGPWAGWLGGWALIASCVIVMGNLAQVAGSYTFLLLGLPDLADSTAWTTAAGVGWILLMTWVCHRGITVSAWVQAGLLVVELLVLAILVCLAFTKAASGSARDRADPPSLAWLWPGGVGMSDLVAATLIGVFLYWGWDTAVSINEESDEPERTPGRAAVLSILLLVTTYALVAMAVVAFAGTGSEGIGLGNPDNADDVFGVLGPAIFGDNALGAALQVLLVISILTSAAASTQTTILPTARSALSMATHGALPERFARMHPTYQTPTFATWATGGASVVFFVGLTAISTNVLLDSITAVALLIAFYYGLTGFACVWYFRHELHGRALWTKGVLPGLGGVLLFTAFVMSVLSYAAPDSGETTVLGFGGVVVISIGSLLLGILLMIAQRRVAPAYFRGETLPRRVTGRPRPPTSAFSSTPALEPDTTQLPPVPSRLFTPPPTPRADTGTSRGRSAHGPGARTGRVSSDGFTRGGSTAGARPQPDHRSLWAEPEPFADERPGPG